MTIMVMGTDDHAMAVMGCLVGMGENVVMLDSRSEWRIYGTDDRLDLHLEGDHRQFNEDTVRSFYWRSYDGVMRGPCSEPQAMNRRSIFESWLRGFEITPMYNSYDAWCTHKMKPYQNGIVREALSKYDNVEVPDSYYGKMLPNHCVKGVQGGAYAVNDPNLWDSSIYPVSQEILKGSTFRVYLIGGNVYTYSIESECFDYRLDPNCVIVRTTIGEDHKQAMQSIARALNWQWFGADLIVDGTHTYVLDVNPSPMFLGFQRENELLTALCKDLAK